MIYWNSGTGVVGVGGRGWTWLEWLGMGWRGVLLGSHAYGSEINRSVERVVNRRLYADVGYVLLYNGMGMSTELFRLIKNNNSDLLVHQDSLSRYAWSTFGNRVADGVCVRRRSGGWHAEVGGLLWRSKAGFSSKESALGEGM